MIEWSDSYSIHNPLIDKQHKKLFELARRAYVMLNSNITAHELKNILSEFFSYVKVHFHDEEEYMARIGYPDLQNHQRIHNELTNSLVSLIKSVKNVNDMKEKLNVIAKQWLLQHILKEDMKIEKFRRMSIDHHSSDGEEAHSEPAATEIYCYGCGCMGKMHDVPLSVHLRIQNGEKFRCKSCKQDIAFLESKEI